MTLRSHDSPSIESLEAMNLDALREAWHQAYGPPPKLRSEELLRLMLAWRLQADTQGGLDRETRRRLQRTGPVQAEGMEIGAGAVLSREWKGKRHDVVVEKGGFRHEGTLYASLSAAATAIAGCRWNGPRFFGLRKGQA